MKVFLANFRNPELKKAIYIWLFFTVLSGILLFVFSQWLTEQFRLDALQHGVKTLAVTRTQGSLEAFLKNGLLTPEAQAEYQRLIDLSVFPDLPFPHTHLPIKVLWSSWVVLCILILGSIIYQFQKFYAHIQRLQNFIKDLSTHRKPYDIRRNQEGDLSILNNQLYDMATALYTQRDTAIQHKNYLDQNIANISHQLKTPLTSLMVVSDTLKLLPLSERTDEKIEQLEPQLERIEHLVQSLLLLSRLDAGVVPLHIESLNAHDFVQNIIQHFTILSQQQAITISCNVSPSYTVYADKFYLGEALTNVLKNALDYTPPQESITITWEDSIFFSTIKVHNIGNPIPFDDLPHIFERFYRGSSPNKKGIGIGLSLAYEIVALHQGKLSAENTATGVLMTLHIPKQ